MTAHESSPEYPTSSRARRLGEIVQAKLPWALGRLADLVRIPSIAWEGFDHGEVQRSAELTASYFRQLELFDSVSVEVALLPDGTPGQPAVLASRASRGGKPTVLLYAHHDVQPVGDARLWSSDPFTPTLRGGRLYGRGTADDKAGVLSHVLALAALKELLLEQGEDFELGLAVYIEGEEEFGSGSFADFLQRHREVLDAEVIIVADSDNWDARTPGLTLSLRGCVAETVTISTLDHAVHSGMYGGAVPDAMMAASMLMASLWDASGSVAVAGLQRHAREVPERDEAEFAAELGVLDGVGLIGDGPVLHRLWAQPALSITGMDLPNVREAANALIPSVRIKLSLRIAPGQDPAAASAAVRAHLEQHAPFGARLSFEEAQLSEAVLVDGDGSAARLMRTAMQDAWGEPPRELGVGGSIPFIAELQRVFPMAQILITGVEDPDTRAHSPDESLDLHVFHRAGLAEALLLERLNRDGLVTGPGPDRE